MTPPFCEGRLDLPPLNGNSIASLASGTLLTFLDLATTPNPFVEDTTICAMINYSGSWNGGISFAGDYLPNSSFVAITAVPEPSTLVLAALGTALVALGVRRPVAGRWSFFATQRGR